MVKNIVHNYSIPLLLTHHLKPEQSNKLSTYSEIQNTKKKWNIKQTSE